MNKRVTTNVLNNMIESLDNDKNFGLRFIRNSFLLCIINWVVVFSKFGSYKEYLKWAYSKKGFFVAIGLTIVEIILCYAITLYPEFKEAVAKETAATKETLGVMPTESTEYRDYIASKATNE